MESTIRVGDYKLIRNYDHVNNPDTPPLELFQLYDSSGGDDSTIQNSRRVDIEEARNLAEAMPERTAAMNARLTDVLTEMQASYPYYSPSYPNPLPGKEQVCSVLSHTQTGKQVEFTYQENGAKVMRADLIYTLNGRERYEEWFRTPATLTGDGKVSVQIPSGTTHYFLNLIDENQFLRSYPEVVKRGKSFADSALRSSDDRD